MSECGANEGNGGDLAACGKRENSGSETPFLTMRTTGGTPVPQCCNGLPGAGDGVNLRMWFAGFLAWLVGLTVAACWGLAEVDGNGSAAGWAVWIFAGYAFYMSLCCTFFPAPTTWIVMLAASDMVAGPAGLGGQAVLRLLIVATIGALATGLANLNEYHVFVYLLRKRRVAKVRDTRLFHLASGWFRTNPFWILTLFSFLPIPLDVIRWLAITARYPRIRFFWGSFVGRWLRYAIWVVAALGLHLSTGQIVAIQVALVGVALIRIVPKLVRHARRRRRDGKGAAAMGRLRRDGPRTDESSPTDRTSLTGP
ncbi:MAG: hypothetical protein JXQ75_19975 [Phycisphaerae bacterium]|nr:hypothetical protein [Phycisphaerae bacterium]